MTKTNRDVEVFVGSSTLLGFRRDLILTLVLSMNLREGVVRHSGLIPNDHDQDIYIVLKARLNETTRFQDVQSEVKRILLELKFKESYAGDS